MSQLSIARWTLEGRINDVFVDVGGSGTADLATGRAEFVLTSSTDLPAGFDLFAAQMICNVAMTGYVAAPGDGDGLSTLSPTGIRVAPRRQGRVYDEAGAELLAIGAVTTLRRDGDELFVDNLIEGTSHLPNVHDVVAAEEYLLPHAGSRATGLAQFRLDTSNGILFGSTTSPYVLDGTEALATPLRRSITVERRTGSPGRELSLAVESAWSRALVLA
jgi:hypothetical protein